MADRDARAQSFPPTRSAGGRLTHSHLNAGITGVAEPLLLSPVEWTRRVERRGSPDARVRGCYFLTLYEMGRRSCKRE